MSNDPFTVVAGGVIGVSGTDLIGNTPKPPPPAPAEPAHAAFTLAEEKQILAWFEGDPEAEHWDTFQKLQSYMYLLEKGLVPPLKKVEPAQVGGSLPPRGAVGGQSKWNGVGKPPQPMEATIVQRGLQVAAIQAAQKANRAKEELQKAQEAEARKAQEQSRGGGGQ